MNKINVGIAGCMGRMGRNLVRAVHLNKDLNFIGGFESSNDKNIGKKIGSILDLKINRTVSKEKEKIISKSNVVIDFTTPQSTKAVVKIATKYNTALVIGTTGLSKEIKKLLNDSSKKIPIFYSANMSIGVNLLFSLTKKTSKVLDVEEYDSEVEEAHHRYKVDAPSGTAIAIGEIISKARNIDFNKKIVLDRTGKKTPRKKGDIGFSVTRGGDIAGEHAIRFISDDDEIILSHKAKNRSIFVGGAIIATKWIVKQKPGLYSMNNILEL